MEYADIKKEEHYVQVSIYKYGGDAQIWIYKNDFFAPPALQWKNNWELPFLSYLIPDSTTRDFEWSY